MGTLVDQLNRIISLRRRHAVSSNSNVNAYDRTCVEPFLYPESRMNEKSTKPVTELTQENKNKNKIPHPVSSLPFVISDWHVYSTTISWLLSERIKRTA